MYLYIGLSPYRMDCQVKPDMNLVKVHPQLSDNMHPVDGALVGAGSLWPIYPTLAHQFQV
jgi:hypothetical protein